MTPPFLERRYSVCEDMGSHSMEIPSWSAYASSKLISQDYVRVLRSFSGKSEQEMLELLVKSEDKDGKLFAKAVSSVFMSLADTSTLVFTLNMTEDFLLADIPARLDFFVDADNDGKKYMVEPLVKLINHNDERVRGKSVYLASLMFSRVPEPKVMLKLVMDFILEKLDSKTRNHEGVSGALLSLTVLLRNQEIRTMFAQTEGLRNLISVLRSHMGNMGMLYNIMLCIWLTCFDPAVRQSIDAPELSVLISLLRSEPFEKVIRVALATIRLVLQDSENIKELCESLIGMGTLKLLDSLKGKKALKDEDLLDDLKWLRETLEENFRVLTTFERHEQELATETLSWSSTVHTDAFWKENALAFEKDDFSSLKKLVSLLHSADPTTAAIACFDIGKFVQYYPNGKLIVENLGGKKEIMLLLQHESQEVQKQALTACSKIMITNWRNVVT